MKLVDANVLLFAVNQASPLQAVLRPWWEEALAGDEPIGLSWVVILAFLRISTNPRAFHRPLTVQSAVTIVEHWLSHPNVRLVRESEEHWRTLQSLLEQTGSAGNLVSDAHLAALAMSQGAELVSCDTDFGRFPKLRWRNPLD